MIFSKWWLSIVSQYNHHCFSIYWDNHHDFSISVAYLSSIPMFSAGCCWLYKSPCLLVKAASWAAPNTGTGRFKKRQGHVEDGDLTVIHRIGPGQWAAHFELVQVLHQLEILQYSRYHLVRHGSHGPFIDGLPFLNMVIFRVYVNLPESKL